MKKRGSGIAVVRELLLAEIERRCAAPLCRAPTRLGLTKREARGYTGFACERCERWHDDVLTEGDIPEWWEELSVANFDAARGEAATAADGAFEAAEPDEFVRRLNEEWRRERAAANTDESGGEFPDEKEMLH
ncbi:MAG: hypothetical protein M3Q76_12320 [Acidobacteriota bacterium]|nr:hypothetical protein [Acidobacteriota bacterium]